MNPADTRESSPSAADEAALVAELRSGDEAAYETLVRQFGARMLSVARRILPDESDAQDALQDAFISAFRSIERFEGGSSLGTWLHRITVNAALMKLRMRRRAAERPIEELLPAFREDGHAVDPPAPWKDSVDAAVARRETRDLVRRCIDQLPDTYREILLLRDIEELDTQATADLLGIEPGAVKTRLHRARLALRTLLDPHLREERAA